MYFAKRSLTILITSLLFSKTFIKSQVVCSEDELIKELYEDIIDNGKILTLNNIKSLIFRST